MRLEPSQRLHWIVSARGKVTDIRGRSHRARKSIQRFQNVIGRFVREPLALEEMVVDAKCKARLRAAPVNALQNIARRIAADVLRSQYLGELNRIFQIL